MDYTDHKEFPRRKNGTFKKRKKDKQKKYKSLGEVPENPTIIDRYRNMDAKGNVNNSAMKTLGDLVAGLILGPYLSATLGKAAPLAGVALTFGGHYLGDDTSIMRVAGMSTMAHSIAKAKEYRQPDSTVLKRLAGVKDDLLLALLLKRYEAEEKKTSANEQTSEVTIEPIQGIESDESVDGLELEQTELQASYSYEPEQNHPVPKQAVVSGFEKEPEEDQEEDNPWNDPMLGFYLDPDQPDFTKF